MPKSTASAKRGMAVWRKTNIWIGTVIAAGTLCWWLEGAQAIEVAVENYVDQLAILLPRMSAALLVGGFAQVLVPRELISR